MSRRWFTWIRPAECEIPRCGKAPDRSVFILGGSRAWLCGEHADALDIARPSRLYPARPELSARR